MVDYLRREMLQKQMKDSMKVSDDLRSIIMRVKLSQMNKRDEEILAEANRIKGTGPRIGSMGIATFTKDEQRQLRDRFLREHGHALPGIGDLGSSESEQEEIETDLNIQKNDPRFAWKTRVKRQIELMKNPELSLAMPVLEPEANQPLQVHVETVEARVFKRLHNITESNSMFSLNNYNRIDLERREALAQMRGQLPIERA